MPMTTPSPTDSPGPQKPSLSEETQLLSTLPLRPASDLSDQETAQIVMPVIAGSQSESSVTREPRTHRRKPKNRSGRHNASSASEAGVGGEVVGNGTKPTVSDEGELIVPLRAVRTRKGYRSVYARMTRRTFWTVLRTTTRTSGELMITFGMIVLLFAAYEVWGVGAAVNAHQDDLNSQLEQAWSPQPTVSSSASPSPTGAPVEGEAIAKLYIPRIKADPWIVVEG